MQVVLLFRSQFSVLPLKVGLNLGFELITLPSQVGVVIFGFVSCLVILGDMYRVVWFIDTFWEILVALCALGCGIELHMVDETVADSFPDAVDGVVLELRAYLNLPCNLESLKFVLISVIKRSGLPKSIFS